MPPTDFSILWSSILFSLKKHTKSKYVCACLSHFLSCFPFSLCLNWSLSRILMSWICCSAFGHAEWLSGLFFFFCQFQLRWEKAGPITRAGGLSEHHATKTHTHSPKTAFIQKKSVQKLDSAIRRWSCLAWRLMTVWERPQECMRRKREEEMSDRKLHQSLWLRCWAVNQED